MAKWLGELPVANLGATSRRVFKALIDLNREPIPSSTRIRNAELFRQPIDFIAHNLRKYYFDVPLPLSPRNRKIATLTRELYSELATPYKIYLQECRYLVKDCGTSQSPKSTRQRDSRYCPDR
ncbi:MAG: hypothetical protein AB2814_02435, partial [Candidatus Sedimenticola endophacoides]